MTQKRSRSSHIFYYALIQLFEKFKKKCGRGLRAKFNPLKPDIAMHILLFVFPKFLMVMFERVLFFQKTRHFVISDNFLSRHMLIWCLNLDK